jgi:hypothetical protein
VRLDSSKILAIAAAILSFVLGFAYGNLFDELYNFHLKDWQTFVGMIVAILLGLLAYWGVQGTQRINVMIREQDRSDQLLPGLRQVDELLLVTRGPLNALRPQSRYQSLLLLDAAVPVEPHVSVEDAVRRKLTLADEHLRAEVAEIFFKLRVHAKMLQEGNLEINRYRARLSAKNTVFSGSSRENLMNMVDTLKENYELENEEMAKALQELEVLARSIKQRIADAEERRVIIRRELGRFFKRG